MVKQSNTLFAHNSINNMAFNIFKYYFTLNKINHKHHTVSSLNSAHSMPTVSLELPTYKTSPGKLWCLYPDRLHGSYRSIDIISNQNSPGERAESFKEILNDLERLKQHNVTVEIIWCPANCNIQYNEVANEEAKKCALALSQCENVEKHLRGTSYSTISKVIREFSNQQWQKLGR